MALTFLTGGARAGKSRLAAALAERAPGDVYLLVTAEARDEEMEQRIAKHRAERAPDWKVIEEPVELEGSIDPVPGEACLVIDCLTLWVSNLLEARHDDEEILSRASRAARSAAFRPGATIAVSNEVGSGIVPMDPVGRRYRDLLGEVNSLWVQEADRSFLVVAGRALELHNLS